MSLDANLRTLAQSRQYIDALLLEMTPNFQLPSKHFVEMAYDELAMLEKMRSAGHSANEIVNSHIDLRHELLRTRDVDHGSVIFDDYFFQSRLRIHISSGRKKSPDLRKRERRNTTAVRQQV